MKLLKEIHLIEGAASILHNISDRCLHNAPPHKQKKLDFNGLNS